MAATTIRKWGNSAGLLIPKTVLKDMGWSFNDELNFKIKGSKLELQKKAQTRTSRKHVDLENLFENWNETYTLPADLGTKSREASWGTPVGNEMTPMDAN